jgi:putative polyhydroxyalkanoate system protein
VADIHIVRQHHLGLAQARKLAFRWAEVAEQTLAMECTYEEGKASDLVLCERAGATGTLKVTKDHFTLDLKLGLLLGVFRARIESEIVENLDALLAAKEPLKAFEHGLAKHDGKKAPKHAAKHHEPKKAAAKKKS